MREARRTARSVWAAIGALWLCVGAVLLLRRALPGESPAPAPATPPAAAAARTAPLAVLESEIPPLPLMEALERLSRQTGAQLVWITGLVSDQQTRGAPAGLTATEALTRLLEGTGLQFESLTLRTFRIVAAAVGPATDAPRTPGEDVSPCIRRGRC
jgi:hypothetical protein